MKKVWEVIKKIGIWIVTVLVAIFTVLFVKEQRDKDNEDLPVHRSPPHDPLQEKRGKYYRQVKAKGPRRDPFNITREK